MQCSYLVQLFTILKPLQEMSFSAPGFASGSVTSSLLSPSSPAPGRRKAAIRNSGARPGIPPGDGDSTSLGQTPHRRVTPRSVATRRHGGHLLEGPDGLDAFPVEHPGRPRPPLGERGRDGDPIAHKGAAAGARVIAMTLMDLFLNPEFVPVAKEYFAEQTAEHEYSPLIGPDDEPAIRLNREKMEAFREAMRPFYSDPDRYDTYLEQLGIEYPRVREGDPRN